jgi:hypothetical protein
MSFDLVFGPSTENVLHQIIHGKQFGRRLLGSPLTTKEKLIQALMDSKERLFFAESGSISGWSYLEQRVLGSMGVAMNVRVFDDGTWYAPSAHVYSEPLEATLLFCPGPLLARTVCWDYNFIVIEGLFKIEQYAKVLEERILPLLLYVQETAERPALVTIPGLGCGMFAGSFKSGINQLFIQTLQDILTRNKERLSKVAMVYHSIYDPEQGEERTEIDISPHTKFLLCRNGPSLLSAPENISPDLKDAPLYKFVAWDHFSWPGNDFFGNSRMTDDGVSAAATSSMANLLPQQAGWDYRYVAEVGKYLPFERDRVRLWRQVSPDERLVPERVLCLK